MKTRVTFNLAYLNPPIHYSNLILVNVSIYIDRCSECSKFYENTSIIISDFELKSL